MLLGESPDIAEFQSNLVTLPRGTKITLLEQRSNDSSLKVEAADDRVGLMTLETNELADKEAQSKLTPPQPAAAGGCPLGASLIIHCLALGARWLHRSR